MYNLEASSSNCMSRTQNIETELYMPHPIGFSVPSATRTMSPVLGGGLPIILSTAPLYTIGFPSLNSCDFPFFSTTFAMPAQAKLSSILPVILTKHYSAISLAKTNYMCILQMMPLDLIVNPSVPKYKITLTFQFIPKYNITP